MVENFGLIKKLAFRLLYVCKPLCITSHWPRDLDPKPFAFYEEDMLVEPNVAPLPRFTSVWREQTIGYIRIDIFYEKVKECPYMVIRA